MAISAIPRPTAKNSCRIRGRANGFTAPETSAATCRTATSNSWAGRISRSRSRATALNLARSSLSSTAIPTLKLQSSLPPAPAINKRLTGYVVPGIDRGLDQTGLDVSLRAYLADRLPPHMVPQKLHMLRELPLTPLGKIDRLALSAMERRLRRRRRPAPGSAGRDRAPREFCRRYCPSSLGPNEIDPEQNLFELGANSLHIVQLQSEIARRFEKSVRVADIFRHPTLRALAGMLDESNNVSGDVILGRERARRRRAAMVHGSIAITGMACRFPGAAGIRQFWVNLARRHRIDRAIDAAGVACSGNRSGVRTKAGLRARGQRSTGRHDVRPGFLRNDAA